VMMIAARGKKYRLRPVTRRDFKPEDIAIKFQRAIEVGNFEVHVPNPDLRVDGAGGGFLVHANM
jgi:hypothetical protein